MNKPNQQTVREIARTAVSYVIRDHLVQAAMAEHGISADNVYAWSEIYDAVLDTIAAGVQEPGEQQLVDPLLAEVKCGRECSEMHTFEQGSCEAAVTAEQQQDGAARRVEAIRARYDTHGFRALSDGQIDELFGFLLGHIADLERERKADTRDVRGLLMALIVLGSRWPAGLERRANRLRNRFADRIAALDAATDGGAE